MLKSLLTSFLLLFSIVLSAQDGTIITQKGDTLHGSIKILSYDLVDRVQFSADKKKTNYTALQLRRVVIDGDQYVPIKFENSVRLMRIIRSGFLSYYAYRAPGQGGYDSRILQKVGDRAFEVPNIGFKKFVGDVVEDCPVVAEKLKKGNLGRNEVEKIVDEYNLCVEESNHRGMGDAGSSKTPVDELVEQMKLKVTSSDIGNKNEIIELLNAITDRYKRKESIPSYMKEGLKGYLGNRDDFKGDMDQLFNLVEN